MGGCQFISPGFRSLWSPIRCVNIFRRKKCETALCVLTIKSCAKWKKNPDNGANLHKTLFGSRPRRVRGAVDFNMSSRTDMKENLAQRIEAVNKAGNELVSLEASALAEMTVEQRINLLQEKIIRYGKDLLRFDHFVLRLLNKNNNQLEVLFGAGAAASPTSEGKENQQIWRACGGGEYRKIYAERENNGITGYVAATRRSYICNNPAQDPHYLPGLDGILCSLTVPLLLYDKLIGTINVESDKSNAFDDEDRLVAELFGRFIAIGLNILDIMTVERYQSTLRTAETVHQKIAEPLSRIVTETAQLLDDYIARDDIRVRLQTVLDDADQISTVLKDIKDGPRGIFNAQVDRDVIPEPELTDKNVLVVDDEEFIRETISDVVKRYGCTVKTTHDGREARLMIDKQNYDLVISDIKLPFADGYDVFAAARSKNKNVPVILMTGFGYDPSHSIVRANKEGLSAVLYKPFKVEQLMSEIRNAMGISEANNQ